MQNKDNIEEKILNEFNEIYGEPFDNSMAKDFPMTIISIKDFIRQALAEQSTLHQREMEERDKDVLREIGECYFCGKNIKELKKLK